MTDNLQLAFAKYHEGKQDEADWLLRVATVEAILFLARQMKPIMLEPPAPRAELSADDLEELAERIFELIRSDKISQQNAVVDLLRFVFSKEDK